MAKHKCQVCVTRRMSGVLDQPRKAGSEQRIIERCDACYRYDSDAEAAIHWTTRFGGRLHYDHRVIVWTPENVATTKSALETLLDAPSKDRLAVMRDIFNDKEIA